MGLSDDSHIDPCRKCRRLLIRSELIPAKKVAIDGLPKNPKARGYFCLPCAKVPDK